MSEVRIPQALLNVIADVNIEEINSHIYTNEKMVSWLSAWHEEVKRELYDFANNHELYEQGKTDALNDFIKKAEEERDNLYNWDADEYENGMRAGYQYSIEIAEKLSGKSNKYNF